MAEGGGKNENPWLDHQLDHDGDDDDEQEVDTTCPFEPGGSSTPYYGGEKIKMHTLPPEQRGFDDTAPSYNENTSARGFYT